MAKSLAERSGSSIIGKQPIWFMDSVNSRINNDSVGVALALLFRQLRMGMARFN